MTNANGNDNCAWPNYVMTMTNNQPNVTNAINANGLTNQPTNIVFNQWPLLTRIDQWPWLLLLYWPWLCIIIDDIDYDYWPLLMILCDNQWRVLAMILLLTNDIIMTNGYY